MKKTKMIGRLHRRAISNIFIILSSDLLVNESLKELCGKIEIDGKSIDFSDSVCILETIS